MTEEDNRKENTESSILKSCKKKKSFYNKDLKLQNNEYTESQEKLIQKNQY